VLVEPVDDRAAAALAGELEPIAGAKDFGQAFESLRPEMLTYPRVDGDLLRRPRAEPGAEPRGQRAAKLFAEGEQAGLGRVVDRPRRRRRSARTLPPAPPEQGRAQ
jgi:hypothetical protein